MVCATRASCSIARLLHSTTSRHPSPDSQESTNHTLCYCHAVGATVGELKGQTLLPVPAADTQQQDQAAKDKAKIHILENSVTTWTKQIKAVLKADPDAALLVRLVVQSALGPFLHAIKDPCQLQGKWTVAARQYLLQQQLPSTAANSSSCSAVIAYHAVYAGSWSVSRAADRA